MGDRIGYHRRLRRPAAIDRRLPDTCTSRDIVHAHLVIAAVSELFEHCAEDGRVQRSIEAGRIARPLAPWSRGGITHHSEQYSSVTLGPSTSHPFRTSSARVRGTHDGDQQRRHRAHTPFRRIVNWVLALATIPGAVAVVVFLYMQVLGTAGCNDQPCPRQGPGELGFTLIQYGAPVVAVVAVSCRSSRHEAEAGSSSRWWRGCC